MISRLVFKPCSIIVLYYNNYNKIIIIHKSSSKMYASKIKIENRVNLNSLMHFIYQ